MSLKQLAGAIAALAAGASMALPAPGPMHARSIVAGRTIPQYQHIFLIMMENHSYGQIIGNPSAPQINRLAREYGLATNYFGVAHPSEPNYVATIGGSYFGIQNDAPYTQHTIAAHSLVDQLTAARLTWTTYQQSLGGTGYTGTVYPSSSNPLYASKHDPFLNFAGVQHNPAQLRHIVPDTQLQADLAHGSAPNFSYIVPDQCHDMHGSPACAGDSAQSLIGKGDSYAGTAVSMIMRSSIWSRGNNAIVITWDEDDSAASPALGCCDANPGGGHVATIVISSHGVRGVRDATAYNHYSLLQTIEAAFGLGCLQHTCDTVHVTPMALLFRGERS